MGETAGIIRRHAILLHCFLDKNGVIVKADSSFFVCSSLVYLQGWLRLVAFVSLEKYPHQPCQAMCKGHDGFVVTTALNQLVSPYA
ncbi:hypothetical protein AB4243_17430 [Enterovibrio norvegicus]|uniref:hypothetical protein n=1 Tax=Enterovibrio norvegicus TaxID=188144 RepID=UPI00354EBD1A